MSMATTDINSEISSTQAQTLPKRTPWLRRLAAALRRDPRWWCGIILLVFVLAALFAPWISPYSPTLYHPAISTQGPSLAHPLGTDDLGRDQLSRVIYGTRISLSVGFVTILMGGICGTILGVIGAYSKGWVDQIITVVVDALLSFPSILFALALVTALGPSVINLSLALAVVRVPIYTRLARGQTLLVSELDYVHASRVSGTPTWKILLRHVLPNIVSPLLVQATVSISLTILDESVLSFLGLGAQPPTPEWGSMITEAEQYLRSDPWMMLGPALAIVIVLVSLNLFGDAVRDYLDPRDTTHAVQG
jgi:peptide/nickel transport system permease protein